MICYNYASWKLQPASYSVAMIPFDYIFIGGLADCSSYQHLLFRITCIIGAV